MDINEAEGSRLESELGEHTKFFQADLASYSSQAAMFQAVWDRWNRIDALLANAGIVDRFSLYMLDRRNQEG